MRRLVMVQCTDTSLLLTGKTQNGTSRRVWKRSRQPVSALILSMPASGRGVRGPLDRQRETFSRLRFGGHGLTPAELKRCVHPSARTKVLEKGLSERDERRLRGQGFDFRSWGDLSLITEALLIPSDDRVR
jgi:hypothetical protein